MNQEQSLLRELSVVQTLHKRTREGKVNWEPSFSYAGAFEAGYGDLVVVIQQIHDPDYPQQPDYKVFIVRRTIGHMISAEPNTLGRVIEEISNSTLRPVMDRVTEEGLNPYNLLGETFEMARRKALKVDDTLDDLLQKLKGA